MGQWSKSILRAIWRRFAAIIGFKNPVGDNKISKRDARKSEGKRKPCNHETVAKACQMTDVDKGTPANSRGCQVRQESKFVQQAILQGIQGTRDEFLLVRQDLAAAQEALVHLSRLTNQVQRLGIEELCWFHRKLSGYNSYDMRSAAEDLAQILQNNFGAEPVIPVPGSPYSSETCERAENCTGDVVKACLNQGWRWQGGILRAYVVTGPRVHESFIA